MELYNDIAKVLLAKGYNVKQDELYNYQKQWKEWYKGDVPEFHHYKEQVLGKVVQKERLTMNMAKKVCEDVAKLLWTEKTGIEVGDEEANKRLWEILDSKENSFTRNFPIFLEKCLAIGTGALIEYKNEYSKTIIDYVLGDIIMPFRYTNSYINGLVTISRFKRIEDKDEIYYTHLTYHEYDGRYYNVKNELYKSTSDGKLGEMVDFNSMFPNIVEVESIETEHPRFQVFNNNLANNLFLDNPMSISIFANSIDRFKAIDMKYDSFYKEFKLGKRRIVVDPSALKKQAQADENGNVNYVQYFDSNDETYVAIAGTNMESDPVKQIDFSLRAEEHINSINSELNWLSSNIGLGANFYKFDGNGIKTATEVMSENSEAFRTKVHFDIVVNDVIYDLVNVICEMERIPITEISIISDDSIIEDKNTELVRAMQEVAQGLRSKKSYLMDIKGMTEDVADKTLQEIQKEKMSNKEAFGFDNVEEE